ncbi:MAG: tRNA (adenosine(37)-N6)-threonylcarbamoyltransferase complex ATPase subunit type 1 TsaE [Caldimonas sp.]
MLETRSALWTDEAACAESAQAIAARPALAEAFVELHGPLGAGKTTFARHLLHSLGVEGSIKSPTYALMEPYRADTGHGGFAIAHFDFYRFDDPLEWEDAGFRDVFAAPGLKLVEWPEKAADQLPRCDLRIVISPRDGAGAVMGTAIDMATDDTADGADRAARDVRFEALSKRGVELLA